MNMDEQNPSPTTTPASIVNPSGESSRDNAEPNMTGALNNLDKKLGNLTDLLVQIFEQKETSVSSVEDQRSSGNERRVASDVESGQDQSTRSRKRKNPNGFQHLQGERPTGIKRQRNSHISSQRDERPAGTKSTKQQNESLTGEHPTGRRRPSASEDEPLQGERPTGRNKTSEVSDSETDSDDDSDSPQRKRASRPRTEDEISTNAGDSADEKADLIELSATPRKTDKEKRATLSGDNSKLLDDLAKSFSEEDESTSPDVELKLADITMKRWGKKLTPEKLKSITDKYHRPANCTSMTRIKCNPEIWSQLGSTKKRTDIQLFNIQQVVLKAASATLQTTNALATSKSSENHTQLLAQSVDTLALLAHAHTQLSQLRRDQIKPILKHEVSTICSAAVKSDSQWLFGNDLAKSLKDAKEANSITASLRNNSYKPYSHNKSPARSNKNMSYKRMQKDFLWRSLQKPFQKRKRPWTKGKTDGSK